MLVGYARVSTLDQNPQLQIDALEQAGCERIFTDHASGARADRPEWNHLKEFIREGDTLVVWKLDRLGRSLRNLIDIVHCLEEHKIGLKILTEGFDTTTNGGRLVFHIFGAIAEYDRAIIRERTQAGLKSARARGRLGGRPKALDAKQAEMARKLFETNASPANICKTLGISRATLYRYVRP